MTNVPFKDNRIIIRIKDGQIRCSTEELMPFEDLLSAFCTVMLGSMKDIVNNQPADRKEEATAALYDAFNCMVSGVLEKFAPDYELRPGLTAAAILKAENEIIMSGGLKDVAPHS